MFHLYRKLKWAYQKFKVSYSLPFIVLVSYTLLGAVIFRKIELIGDMERREMYKNSTEYAFDQVMKRLKNVKCEKSGLKVDPGEQEKYAKEALFWFIDYLNLTQVIEDRTAATPWTWMGSALYAGQLYTTIGYGYPLVATNLGKVISILYIMIGIPIFLIILKDVGKLLSRALRKIYKRWRTAKNRIPDNAAVRRMSEPVKAIYSLTGGGNEKSYSPKSSENHSLAAASPTKTISTTKDLEMQFEKEEQKEQEEQEIKNKNSSGHFPIPLALTLLVVWILGSAALFCVWETEWGYLTSVYFFFVSISTVGLGDIVPTKPDMMLINFVLILIGLALLSMCVTLIQDAVERIIEQLLQEYIEEIEKMAAIVTSDNEFVEESATPFEVGMSADLLTAPLTAFSKEQESWITSFPQKAKDWMAEKLVDKFLVKQLDSHSDSDDSDDENEEDEQLEGVRVEDGRQETPDRLSSQNKDAISKASKNKKRRPFRNRGFILNYNLPTLRTIQAMEKVKIKTQNNPTFRGRLFAKFAANKKFGKYLDDHIVEPPITNMAQIGESCGVPQKKSSQGSPASWRCRLVTPESVIGSTKSSIATASTAFDQDSLYSAAYHDVEFGYSTESVPKLIEKERKQMEQEEKLEKLKQRRASKDSIPPMIIIPKDMVVIAPPLAELDETVPIKIKVNRSSDSPEPIETKMPDSYALDPHQSSLIDRRRRASTPFLTLNTSAAALNIDPFTKMPMMRCPSCLHLSTAPSASASATPEHKNHKHLYSSESNSPDENAKVFKRVQSLCGLLPSDFTPVQSPTQLHYPHPQQQQQHQQRTQSPSPSRCEDSGYDNTTMTDSLMMTDSLLNGSSSFMPTIFVKPSANTDNNDEDDERIGNGKILDKK